jgi:hypothetical protein
MKAMELKPEGRHQRIQEFMNDLLGYAEGNYSVASQQTQMNNTSSQYSNQTSMSQTKEATIAANPSEKAWLTGAAVTLIITVICVLWNIWNGIGIDIFYNEIAGIAYIVSYLLLLVTGFILLIKSRSNNSSVDGVRRQMSVPLIIYGAIVTLLYVQSYVYVVDKYGDGFYMDYILMSLFRNIAFLFFAITLAQLNRMLLKTASVILIVISCITIVWNIINYEDAMLMFLIELILVPVSFILLAKAFVLKKKIYGENKQSSLESEYRNQTVMAQTKETTIAANPSKKAWLTGAAVILIIAALFPWLNIFCSWLGIWNILNIRYFYDTTTLIACIVSSFLLLVTGFILLIKSRSHNSSIDRVQRQVSVPLIIYGAIVTILYIRHVSVFRYELERYEVDLFMSLFRNIAFLFFAITLARLNKELLKTAFVILIIISCITIVWNIYILNIFIDSDYFTYSGYSSYYYYYYYYLNYLKYSTMEKIMFLIELILVPVSFILLATAFMLKKKTGSGNKQSPKSY